MCARSLTGETVLSQVQTGLRCSTQTAEEPLAGNLTLNLIWKQKNISHKSEPGSISTKLIHNLVIYWSENSGRQYQNGRRRRLGQTTDKAVYQDGDKTGWSGTGKVDTEECVQKSIQEGLAWAQNNLAKSECQTGGLKSEYLEKTQVCWIELINME